MPSPRVRGSDQPGTWIDLGRFCAERRLDLRLTQRDLADLAGVSVSSVRGLESGRFAPRTDVLLQIADALGLRLVVGSAPQVRAAEGSGALRIRPGAVTDEVATG